MGNTSGSEKKVNKNTYDIFSKKRVTKKFLEVSNCSHAKQRQRNIQKNCTALGRVVQVSAKFEFRFESLKSISVLILLTTI